MYAYQVYFAEISTLVEQETDNFPFIENTLSKYLAPVMDEFTSFMSK